jgi:6-pyruvoyltetrahydropterin/6-carboxytetrahydropterin synthase
MKAYFTRAYTISASHRLHADSLSVEENRATFGKCNNPHGHGHNYRIEVTVGGPVDAATGMVINMATLDAVVKEKVIARFDHMNLNLDPLFSQRVSTTENLCIAIYSLSCPPWNRRYWRRFASKRRRTIFLSTPAAEYPEIAALN